MTVLIILKELFTIPEFIVNLCCSIFSFMCFVAHCFYCCLISFSQCIVCPSTMHSLLSFFFQPVYCMSFYDAQLMSFFFQPVHCMSFYDAQLMSFFFQPVYCNSFYDAQLMITPLASPSFPLQSYNMLIKLYLQLKYRSEETNFVYD